MHYYTYFHNNDIETATVPVWVLNNPPVVNVFKNVAGDLLLVTASTVVRVTNRVQMRVRMQPARTIGYVVCLSQRYLRPISNVQGLALGYGCQTTLTNEQTLHILEGRT